MGDNFLFIRSCIIDTIALKSHRYQDFSIFPASYPSCSVASWLAPLIIPRTCVDEQAESILLLLLQLTAFMLNFPGLHDHYTDRTQEKVQISKASTGYSSIV